MNTQNNTNPNPAADTVSKRQQHWLSSDGVCFTLVFTIISALLCYPIVLHPAGHLYFIPVADKGTNLWNLWWVYYALFERHVSPLWCDLIFYPWGGDLRFHTLSIINGIIASPITALWGPVISYNILFLVWTILTGVFAALWGRLFGLSRSTAVAFGFIAAFHPFRWNHVDHLNLFSTAWLMAAFYYCERWMQKKSLMNFIWFLMMWILALFTDWYFGLFVGLYYGIRLAVEMGCSRNHVTIAQWIYTLILPLTVLGGLVTIYFQPPNPHPPFPVVPDDISMVYSSYWSFTVFHFFTPLWLLSLLPSITKTGAEFALHPGFLQMGLGIVCLIFWKRIELHKETKLFLLLLISLFALIALGPLLQIQISIVTIAGFPVPMPAMVFEMIPGLTSMRVFARFAFVAWLAISMIGLLWMQTILFPKLAYGFQSVILVLVVAVFLLETEWKPLPMLEYEKKFDEMEGPVLELPIEPTIVSGKHLYHQTLHHQPIYAVEISRISTYRKAYLETFPFLLQMSGYISGKPVTVADEAVMKSRFCNELNQLQVKHLYLINTNSVDVMIQQRNEDMRQLWEECNKTHSESD